MSETGAMGDAKEREGRWTQFDDVTGNAIHDHGIFVVTLATGDKVCYNYHGTQTVKDAKCSPAPTAGLLQAAPANFEGVKGEGGCKGKGNPDGTSTWTCEGTYSMGK